MFVGIDPGWSGGIAYIDPTGFYRAVAIHGMTPHDVCSWMENNLHNVQHVALEKVHAMPKQGVSSSFNFGRCYGMLEAFLVAAAVPYDLVTPQRWQRDLDCLTRGKKNVTKLRAQQLFPKIKVTHAIADALVLAEWCRGHYAVSGGEE